jgi:hypothetical protein
MSHHFISPSEEPRANLEGDPATAGQLGRAMSLGLEMGKFGDQCFLLPWPVLFLK